jgi:hypothetical protein
VNGFVNADASSSRRRHLVLAGAADARRRCITSARERLHYDRTGTRRLRQRGNAGFPALRQRQQKVTTLVTDLLLHQRNVIDTDKILKGDQVHTFNARF